MVDKNRNFYVLLFIISIIIKNLPIVKQKFQQDNNFLLEIEVI